LEPTNNSLIAAMTDRVASELRSCLVPVELRLGDVLHEANVDQAYVYFPTAGVVSLLYLMRDGLTAEIALVGRDGLVGLASALGGSRATSRATVQVGGHAYRAPVKSVRALMAVAESRDVLVRYAQVAMAQMSQTAVCNRHHSLVQQLCRWILHSLDLVEGNEIQMTQRLIAEMLGVRREGVSLVAGALKAERIIEYDRGHMRIVDRAAMEKRVCECYAVVVAETKRLLPRARRRASS
jgi:CRP-like cAMP-binding protein